MSECVVRMDMPISCYDCEIRDGKAYCPICGATLVGYKRSKHENCPIICQLPEGHGRLVDKDEMLKKIENYHRYMTIGRESDPRCIIEDSPTIVPAERSEI